MDAPRGNVREVEWQSTKLSDEKDAVEFTALELAREIALNCAPVRVALTKKMLFELFGEPDVAKAERIHHKYFGWFGSQADAREGVVSYPEKRTSSWKLKVPGDMPDF